MLVLFLTLLTVTTAWDRNSGTQLNYDQQDWGGLCTTGRAQSPIDIPAPTHKVEVSESSSFLTLPRKNFMMTNKNSPIALEFAVNPAGSKARVPWLNNRRVTLVLLHLHWGETAAHGSENMIKGKAYAAEAHLVASYTASDGTSKYMVFARVFHTGRESPEIDQMIEASKEQDGNRNIDQFDLSALFPADAENWVTYDGSLTAPPCSEEVEWVMVKKPLMTISKKQLKKLRRMQLGSGNMDAMPNNHRNIQPLNGREITKYHRG